MMPGMASDTSVQYGNEYYIHVCKYCGGDREFCHCYIQDVEEKPYAKFTKNIQNNYVLFAPIPCCIVRKSPSHISGMRGLKLMRRLNKR